MNVNFTIQIQERSQLHSGLLIFYCTGLKFSAKAQLSGPAFALALFEQQNIVSESKTISNFIKIIVCIKIKKDIFYYD